MSKLQKFNIRRSTPNHAADVITGINMICAEGGAFYTPHFISSPAWDNVLYAPDQHLDHLLVVAEVDGVFAGSARLFPEPAHSYASHVVELGMFVLPPYRRLGIGKALLEWGIAWASTQAYERITLGVFASNWPAIALYQQLGFAQELTMRLCRTTGNENW